MEEKHIIIRDINPNKEYYRIDEIAHMSEGIIRKSDIEKNILYDDYNIQIVVYNDGSINISDNESNYHSLSIPPELLKLLEDALNKAKKALG